MIIQEILNWAELSGYQFEFIGDKNTEIDSFSSLTHYRAGSLTWIKKHVPEDMELLSSITCAVVQKGLKPDINNIIFSSNSKELFFSILAEFFSVPQDNEARQVGTYIGKNVKYDESVQIGCNCVLDGEIQIGKGTIIEHNVVIMNKVRIGENCIIHSGTVIGKDGFGFAFDKDNLPVKAKHFGGVEIGDRVEIGANCTVDRGTIDNTIIGDDTKIDSLCIVAHNVEIGKGNLIVGCTNLGGSTKVGDKSYIGPKVCIKNQISIGSNSFIGMGVVVYDSLGDSMTVARNDSQALRNRNYRRFL